MTRARLTTETSRQSSKALPAAATAASTSAVSASRTSACCSPVAGFQTGAVRVEAPVVSEPPIQCSIFLMTALLGSLSPGRRTISAAD